MLRLGKHVDVFRQMPSLKRKSKLTLNQLISCFLSMIIPKKAKASCKLSHYGIGQS